MTITRYQSPKKDKLMQHLPKLKPLLLVICLIAIGTSSIAWYNNAGTGGMQGSNTLDTLPKREKKVRAKTQKEKTTINGDIDESLQELERVTKELEEKFQGKEWKKAQKEMAEAMEELNSEKIQQEIQEAMKNIEVDKIRMQAEMQLKQIDVQKIQKEVQKALTEAKYNYNGDSKKMEVEIQKAMEESRKAMSEFKKVDMEKMMAELEFSKEQLKKQQWKIKDEMENVKKHLKENMNKDVNEELEKAKEEIGRAKEELQGYKNMLSEMEKEGLLSTKENYTVEYKDGELSINGKKQSDTVSDKYKHYFKKDNVTIKHDKDDAKTIRL
jgi:chromosome segregation ATPase